MKFILKSQQLQNSWQLSQNKIMYTEAVFRENNWSFFSFDKYQKNFEKAIVFVVYLFRYQY